MKITNEIFNRYMQCIADEKKIIGLAEELGFDNPADLEEDIMIWAVNHGDKTKVMKFYEMDEAEYAEAQELWADESERGTK